MFYDEYIKLCNSIQKSPTLVAKEIGLSGAHVTKWKNGRTPTDATIFKVCSYFGIPTEYFSVNEKKAPTKSDKHAVNDDDIKFALFGTREIDDDVLEQVKSFAKFARENRKDK